MKTMLDMLLEAIKQYKKENTEEARIMLAMVREEVSTLPVYTNDPVNQKIILNAIDA